MKKDLKDKWVTALRSGEYIQNTAMGQLKSGTSTKFRQDNGEPYYCCLGVLAEVAGLEISSNGMNIISKEGEQTGYSVLQELILGDSNTEITTRNFYNLNDTLKKNFNEIADFIEEEL